MSEVLLSRVLVRTKSLLEVEMKRAAEDRLNAEAIKMHFDSFCAEEGVGFATRNQVQNESSEAPKPN